MALKEIVQLVGLGTPFYFAGATYWYFNWLNRNASAQATRAISAWLKSEPYSPAAVEHAILATFDRLYTFPLLRRRAFLRSAAISAMVFLAYTAFVFPRRWPPLSRYVIIPTFSTFIWIIFSDYASLFMVRL
jgi:hypothetical protein